LLSVASATALAKASDAPKIVSSDFAKLEVSRYLICGADCAMAGFAMAAAARPMPAAVNGVSSQSISNWAASGRRRLRRVKAGSLRAENAHRCSGRMHAAHDLKRSRG
jgi:hypothetical protein